MSQSILVVGATGKQGVSFVRAVLADDHGSGRFQVVALTRDPETPSAKALAALSPRVSLAQANLDKPDSVRKVFRDAQQPFWGVFVVLAFPGLGADSTGEAKQGVLLADLAVEYKVKCFVYSSAERGGDSAARDTNYLEDHAAKVTIEKHIKSLETLPWIIIRPGFFMENFDGTIGKITAAVLRCGLNPETPVQLIAADDIGKVAHAIFKSPNQYFSKSIPVIGDVLTYQELADAYQRGSGQPLPTVANFIAKPLIAINGSVKKLLLDMETTIVHRKESEESFDQILADCRAVYPGMTSFDSWAKGQKRDDERTKKWNNVSIWELILGRK